MVINFVAVIKGKLVRGPPNHSLLLIQKLDGSSHVSDERREECPRKPRERWNRGTGIQNKKHEVDFGSRLGWGKLFRG